jgi:hypothetical protein
VIYFEKFLSRFKDGFQKILCVNFLIEYFPNHRTFFPFRENNVLAGSR